MVEWTEDRVTTLRRMWAEGATARMIAVEVGTTRNSVVGKAHRLHLGRFRAEAKAKVRRVRPREPPYESLSLRLFKTTGCETPFYDLGLDQCHWILGETAYDALACGRPVTRRCYCQAHAEAAYRKPEPRRT